VETLQAIAARKSVRGFTAEKITDRELDIILKAGNAAPVGMGAFNSMAFNVIQDRDLLDRISEAAVKGTPRENTDIYYGASTVIIISSAKQPFEALAYANAGCIVQNLLLAATDIGVDSVYVFGTNQGFAQNPALLKEANIPDGFTPVSSVVLGHATEEQAATPKTEREIAIYK
jgi:nitroreductase